MSSGAGVGLHLQVGEWIKRLPTVDEVTGEMEPNLAGPEARGEGDSGSSRAASEPTKLFQELGDPLDLAQSPEKSSDFITRLEAACRVEQGELLDWLFEAIRPLALSRPGCRVVQKALEVAGAKWRDKLVAVLGQFIVELYESPNGNHVLTKVVEVVPSAALGSIIQKLREKGASSVARHRFGCRVLERLIEHCSERELKGLLDQIITDAEMLARHQYGNFVVQHLLEHGTVEQRKTITERLINSMPRLAMHRTASHVVQRLLDYSDEERQHMVLASLLQAEVPASLVEIACSRYGSFVAEQLAGLGVTREPVRQRLAERLVDLGGSPFGRRVAERFGLEVPFSDTIMAPAELPEGDSDNEE